VALRAGARHGGAGSGPGGSCLHTDFFRTKRPAA
jgi:hypothetical protein